LCALLIGLSVGGNGQKIPTTDECDATFDSIGEDSLTKTFTPCALGGGASCCSALSSTLDVASGAPLSGCLCNQEVMDAVVEILEGNTLAKAVGFGKDRLDQILRECNTDFVGSGACNQAPPPPPQPVQTQPAQSIGTPQIPRPTPTTQPAERKPPSLKPVSQPPQLRPQQPQPAGERAIRGEDGQIYYIVPEGGAVAAGARPGGAQVGKVIKGEDGKLYEVVGEIPGKGGPPVQGGGLLGGIGGGSTPILGSIRGTIRDTIQGTVGTLTGMLG